MPYKMVSIRSISQAVGENKHVTKDLDLADVLNFLEGKGYVPVHIIQHQSSLHVVMYREIISDDAASHETEAETVARLVEPDIESEEHEPGPDLTYPDATAKPSPTPEPPTNAAQPLADAHVMQTEDIPESETGLR